MCVSMLLVKSLLSVRVNIVRGFCFALFFENVCFENSQIPMYSLFRLCLVESDTILIADFFQLVTRRGQRVKLVPEHWINICFSLLPLPASGL